MIERSNIITEIRGDESALPSGWTSSTATSGANTLGAGDPVPGLTGPTLRQSCVVTGGSNAQLLYTVSSGHVILTAFVRFKTVHPTSERTILRLAASGIQANLNIQTNGAGLVIAEGVGAVTANFGPAIALDRWYVLELEALRVASSETTCTGRVWSLDGTLRGSNLVQGAYGAGNFTQAQINMFTGGNGRQHDVAGVCINYTASRGPLLAIRGRRGVRIPNSAARWLGGARQWERFGAVA